MENVISSFLLFSNLFCFVLFICLVFIFIFIDVVGIIMVIVSLGNPRKIPKNLSASLLGESAMDCGEVSAALLRPQ